MLKAIIFDFDGVICESVEVKTVAFRKLFLDFPEQLDEIMDYHIKNGGISRFKKFEHIYKEIIQLPLNAATSEELGRKFTEYAYTEVVNAPLVEGAGEFLNKFYTKIKLFVASGTPEDEMISIVKTRKMEKYFAGVYGSPKTKHEITALILNKEKLHAHEVVFVGDSINDYHGAHQANVPFIGRLHQQYADPFQAQNIFAKIPNLNNLESLIGE